MHVVWQLLELVSNVAGISIFRCASLDSGDTPPYDWLGTISSMHGLALSKISTNVFGFWKKSNPPSPAYLNQEHEILRFFFTTLCSWMEWGWSSGNHRPRTKVG